MSMCIEQERAATRRPVTRRVRWPRVTVCLGVLFAATLGSPSALVPHEIPAEVTVRAFIVPEGNVLRFLVRVPLEAMRDFAFPLRGPGFLDLERAGPALRDAAVLWVGDYIEFFEDGATLGPERLVAVRISLPSDPSFRTLGQARAHLSGGSLPNSVDLPWQQAMLDAEFEVPIASEGADFSVEPNLAHLGLRTLTVLRFVPPNAPERAFQFTGNPGRVRLDPRWHQAALRFVRLGFEHILDGIDHLLFLLCLVIPFRRFWALVPVITAFTIAHSITLVSSAFGLVPRGLWFPPLIETLIALSIVYMAIENIIGTNFKRRWVVAFGFGLVHGFGFSFALSETLQFAGSHLLTSLLSFNIGVELGQLLVVVVTVPLLSWFFRRVNSQAAVIVTSALIAHTAWHWLSERAAELVQYDAPRFALTASVGSALLRWAILALVAGTAVWLVWKPFERWSSRDLGSPGDVR